MAQITRAERIQAFLFLLIGLVLTATVILTLIGLPFQPEPRTFYLQFTDTVTGIDKGSDVRYKGVKVGKIKSIRVHEPREEIIRVELEVSPEAPIKVSTVARISTFSILGPFHVELLDSRSQSPPLVPGSEIPAVPSTLELLLRRGENLAAQLIRVLGNIEELTNSDTRGGIASAVAQFTQSLKTLQSSAETLTPHVSKTLAVYERLGEASLAVIEESRLPLQRLLTELSQASGELNTFLRNGQLQELGEEAQRTLRVLTQEIVADSTAVKAWLAANTYKEDAGRIVSVLESLEKSVSGTLNRLEGDARQLLRAELAPTLESLRQASTALGALAQALERQPRALIFGEPSADPPLRRKNP